MHKKASRPHLMAMAVLLMLDLARQAKNNDEDGYRGEFIEVEEKGRSLARKGA